MARKNSGRLTLAKVRKQYDYYNKTLFFNSLPRHVEFAVTKRHDCLAETAEMADLNGVVLYYRIEFSRQFWNLHSSRLTFIILLHEMTHLAAGLSHQHDKVFEKAIKRLTRSGAYDTLL